MAKCVRNRLTVSGLNPAAVVEKMGETMGERIEIGKVETTPVGTTPVGTVIDFDSNWEAPYEEIRTLSTLFPKNFFRLLSWGIYVAEYGVTLVNFTNGSWIERDPKEAWTDETRRRAEKYKVTTLTDAFSKQWSKTTEDTNNTTYDPETNTVTVDDVEEVGTTGTIVIDGVVRQWEFVGEHDGGFVIESFEASSKEQHQEIYYAIVDELQRFPWNVRRDDGDDDDGDEPEVDREDNAPLIVKPKLKAMVARASA